MRMTLGARLSKPQRYSKHLNIDSVRRSVEQEGKPRLGRLEQGPAWIASIRVVLSIQKLVNPRYPRKFHLSWLTSPNHMRSVVSASHGPHSIQEFPATQDIIVKDRTPMSSFLPSTKHCTQ